MKIDEFVSSYKNHPVLFVGTGFSLRYLSNSYTWDGLLSEVALKIFNNSEAYLDIKSKYEDQFGYNYPKIASDLEENLTTILNPIEMGI